MKQHGIGILGAGMIGAAHAFGYRTHCPRFADRLHGLRLAVVADPNEALARTLASTYGFEGTATDWKAVMDNPAIGIVSVALPNFLHVDAVDAALQAGKHVLCEKPLALSAADARRLYEAAKGTEVCAATVFNYRRIPAVIEIRNRIAAGEMGEIVNILVQFQCEYAADPYLPHSWRYERDRAGSGALADIGTHAIDTARYLCGEIDEIVGAVSNISIKERFVAAGATVGHDRGDLSTEKKTVDNDDVMSALLRFRSGAQGLFSASRVAIGMGNTLSFEVFGTKASAKFSTKLLNQYEIARFDGSGQTPFATVANRPSSPNLKEMLPVPYDGVGVGYAEIFGFMIHDFLTAIAERKPIASGTLLDGLRVAEILDAIQRSAETGTATRIAHAPA
ncbi:Gfo/Idh/MocA family oxidoreductase [Rhizobium sp. ARZ01]|uniref:Gfo/Idh/MocA family protein n=1 Tax=Rhizobium sp. ARZ01 TaxID=2769313 RepID=UPI00178778D8|nr:Gfo/Idh/MocA family oxidoreductase [Rhizobium sp. ARZ01]MBD9375367.1 Gfo/Idh/MocA family oxidoreductase [Rhizobium sp. ARZ01]